MNLRKGTNGRSPERERGKVAARLASQSPFVAPYLYDLRSPVFSMIALRSFRSYLTRPAMVAPHTFKKQNDARLQSLVTG
jgi:hypothetical protein